MRRGISLTLASCLTMGVLVTVFFLDRDANDRGAPALTACIVPSGPCAPNADLHSSFYCCGGGVCVPSGQGYGVCQACNGLETNFDNGSSGYVTTGASAGGVGPWAIAQEFVPESPGRPAYTNGFYKTGAFPATNDGPQYAELKLSLNVTQHSSLEFDVVLNNKFYNAPTTGTPPMPYNSPTAIKVELFDSASPGVSGAPIFTSGPYFDENAANGSHTDYVKTNTLAQGIHYFTIRVTRYHNGASPETLPNEPEDLVRIDNLNLRTCGTYTPITANAPSPPTISASIPPSKPLTSITNLDVATITGGSPPYTLEAFAGLPQSLSSYPTPSLNAQLVGDKVRITTGIVPVNAANPAQTAFSWWNPSTWTAQTSGSGPLPGGRSYPITISVKDANNQIASTSVNWQINPLQSDVQLIDGCACFNGIQKCDIHSVNQGPDIVPQVNSQLSFNGITYQGDESPPEVMPAMGGGSVANALGIGTTTFANNTIQWKSGTTPVPVNGDFAGWPILFQTSQGNPGSRTSGLTLPYSIDTNPANNAGGGTLPNVCNSKSNTPTGPVCQNNSILYVMAVGQTGVSTFNFTDQLDSCLDPTTLTGLTPGGCTLNNSVITCNNIPINTTPTNQVVMISYSIKPKANCPAGTVIKNKGHAVFPNGTSFDTNEVQNTFCPCNNLNCAPLPTPSSAGGGSKSSSSIRSLSSAASNASTASTASAASNASAAGSSKSSSSAGAAQSGASAASNGSAASGANASNASKNSVSSIITLAGASSQSAGTATSVTASNGTAQSASSRTSQISTSARSSSLGGLFSSRASTPSATSSRASSMLSAHTSSHSSFQAAQSSAPLVPSSARSSASSAASFFCTSDDQCPAGQQCQNSLCVSHSSSSAASPEHCDPDICANGGDAYCAGQNLRCEPMAIAPCLRCVQLEQGSSSSADLGCNGDAECTIGRCIDQSCTPCAQNDECPSNLCIAGECSLCTIDEQCLGDRVCRNGSCVPPTLAASSSSSSLACTQDSQCVSNLCIGNRCIPCAQNSQCLSNLCRSGICVPCSSNLDCGQGFVCIDNRCVAQRPAASPPVQALPASVFDLPFTPTTQQIAGGPQQYNLPLSQPQYVYVEAKGKGPSTTDSGPETVLLMAGGAAAGMAWIRRRRQN